MIKPLIAAANVTKTYPNSAAGRVLNDVSVTVEKGSFVSLMGASGSGKTTLLNLIGGLDTPDGGIIDVLGTNLHSLSDDARSNFRLRHIGFVFQFFNLLPNLSVEENIALPLLFLGRPEREASQAAGAIAEEVGLGEKTRRMVHQLSGGEMQRVGLARALVHQPEVLLADEPTGNLDSKTGATILELIRRTAREHGVTVLMATHDPKSAEYCDATVRMADGQVVTEQPA